MGENQIKGAFNGGTSSQADKSAEENKFWAVEENLYWIKLSSLCFKTLSFVHLEYSSFICISCLL